MKQTSLLKKLGIVAIAAMTMSSAVYSSGVNVYANEVSRMYGAIGGVVNSPNKTKNVVDLQLENGRLRVTFLKDNEFRLNFEAEGNEFVVNAKPYVSKEFDKVHILEKKDSDYAGVEPRIFEDDQEIILATDSISLIINKEESLMKLTKNNGDVLWEEAEPIKIENGRTIQTLKTDADEYFYGGGTQNGYFSHKNTKIKVEKGGGWEDGGRSNPVPFYMSTKGYSVLRHTFTPGEYDFSETATFMHKEERFDAYYYVNESLDGHLDSFTEMTGRPIFWPRWGQYIGHADCYNYNANTGEREINEHALDLLYRYIKDENFETEMGATGHNIPLGWMLVNDGYGCHYGKTGTVDGNIENLKSFVDIASELGVEVGLWTQSNLDNESPEILRNLYKEVVTAGIRGIKTDVAWVGAGYDMQMNSVKTGYDGLALSGQRPFIFSLFGWAGSQRYAGMWSGDQTGGRWEYIRFQIPTYIGSGLSGQPNIGSDIDSIYKGSKTIAIRDLQWKVFTPMLYNMGGWDGSKADELDGKTPWEFGDEAEAIQRLYLKLRAEMMPYVYTNAYETSQNGKPMLRAMILDYPNDPYTWGKETQYQFMWGDNLLVAPIYEGSGKDTDIGVRNHIYLPDENQVWIDFWSGEQYQGGQILNNYDAPIWKLPVFIKAGAIMPYTEDNNTSKEITDAMDRIFDVYPAGDSTFTIYEDDGESLVTGTAFTKITSSAPSMKEQADEDGTAIITIEKRLETDFDAIKENKATVFQINTVKDPTNVTLLFNGEEVELERVTKEEYDAMVVNDDYSKNVYYFAEAGLNLNKYEQAELINNGEIITGSKLIVRTVKVDVAAVETQVIVEGFNNAQALATNEVVDLETPTFDEVKEEHTTPTSILLTWNEVANATSYDVEFENVRGHVQVVSGLSNSYLHKDLENATTYSYRVRARNDEGVSEWSNRVIATSKEDPFKRTPETITATWDGTVGSYSGSPSDIVDKSFATQWHSQQGAIGTNVTLDMKYVYPMESLVYVPRQDYLGIGGNGLVTKMNISVSIDGVTWKEVKNNYVVDASQQLGQFMEKYADEITFDSIEYARYIRMEILDAKGDFFTADEVLPIIAEGGNPRTPGTPLEHQNTLGDSDLIPMKMYSGQMIGEASWGQVDAADINYNGINDAYDLVFMTSQMGKTLRPSKDKTISGIMSVVPTTRTAIQAGDEITFNLVATGFKDINALSAEIQYRNEEFEVIAANDAAFAPSIKAYTMLNHTRTFNRAEGLGAIFVNLANVGEQTRLNGDFVIGSFTLRAKVDGANPELIMPRASIVNSNFVEKTALTTEGVVPPAPGSKIQFVPKSEMANITLTNDCTEQAEGLLCDADAANITKMIQQGNINSWFDGSLGEGAELKWDYAANHVDGQLPSYVRVPLNITVTFDEAKPLSKIELFGRSSGNGGIIKAQAQAFYNGEVVAVSEVQGVAGAFFWTFDEPTLVDTVIVTPLETTGLANTGNHGSDNRNRMLTISEIRFTEVLDVLVSSVEFTKDAYELNIGNNTLIEATIKPELANDKRYEMTTSDESIAKVERLFDADGSTIFLLSALAAGTTQITVRSLENPAISHTVDVVVKDGLELNDYEFFTNLAISKLAQEGLYTESSRRPVEQALAALNALDLEAVNQTTLDTHVLQLVIAINGLEVFTTDVSKVITNSVLFASADFHAGNDVADKVLDGNEDTYWESPWSGVNSYLPKALVIELPEVIKVNQFDYVPAKSRNGLITAYEVYTSVDGVEYTLATEGNVIRKNESDYSTVEIKFGATQAKYIKFVATQALGRIPEEDNKYVRVAEVRVYGEANVYELGFEKNEVVGLVGTTIKNPVVINPTYANEKVTYASSDEGIATVDAFGNVELHSVGQVTITVRSSNASASYIISSVDIYNQIEEVVARADEILASMNQNHYSPASFTAFADALIAAKAAYEANDVAMMVEAYATLVAAMENLEQVVFVDALVEAIEAAKELVKDETLTPAYVTALQDAITNAKAMIEQATSQEQIEEEVLLLTHLMERPIFKGDKTELSTLVNEAKAYLSSGMYTEASMKNLQIAYERAVAIINDENAAQQDVNKAFAVLEFAIETIVEKTEETPVYKDGWNEVEGVWYYYTNNVKSTDWLKLANITYYLDPTTGAMVTGWRFIDNTWYYFLGNGHMATSGEVDGWIISSTGAAYPKPSNAETYKDGWHYIDQTWYYYTNGSKQTSWIQDGTTWYYLNPTTGAMMTGWLKLGNIWYYLEPTSGAMATGWKFINHTWYYLYENGHMATSGIIDGWVISANGAAYPNK